MHVRLWSDVGVDEPPRAQPLQGALNDDAELVRLTAELRSAICCPPEAVERRSTEKALKAHRAFGGRPM